MITPSTTVIRSESTSIIVGTWCIIEVNMGKDKIPIIEEIANLHPICL